MAAAHFKTRPAKIRAIAERLTDRQGAFHSLDVEAACNNSGLKIQTTFEVRNALNYLVKCGELKNRGAGWYVWLMEG